VLENVLFSGLAVSLLLRETDGEPEEELGAWEDVVWPDFEQAYKAYMLEQVAELEANESAA
jgi:hypothetical protein